MYSQSANISEGEAQDFKILAVLRGKSGRKLAGDVLREYLKKNRRAINATKNGDSTNGGRKSSSE